MNGGGTDSLKNTDLVYHEQTRWRAWSSQIKAQHLNQTGKRESWAHVESPTKVSATDRTILNMDNDVFHFQIPFIPVWFCKVCILN